ncbi:MAG: T9SS type A sorting domain-containing protein [Flavobacteriales bacterium]
MRLFLTTLIFLIFSISLNAQFWITSVTSSPFPANDCDIVSIVIDGNMASSNCTHTSSYLISGNTITIDINITCGGLGLPVITPYNETIILGTIPSNNYVLIVNQSSAGTLLETNTSSLNIGTCCASNASISLVSSSNCLGEPTSFIDLGTLADSLVWSDNGVVFTPNPSALGWIYIFNSSGVHNVILTTIDSTGCSDTNNLVVTVNDLPEILMSSVPATCATCQNGEAFVNVVSGPMPHQVLWNVGGTLNPLTGLNPGNYVATLTDGNLCSVTDSVLVGNSVSINEYKSNDFLIYPNPSSGNIFLNFFNNENNSIDIKVFNLSGQLIENRFFSGELNTTYEINLDLSKGIYIIKVNNFTEKIVIQ